MRRILLAVVASSLVLAGCGGSDSGSGTSKLDAVKVSKAKSPKVSVTKGFTTKKTTSKVLNDGSGDKLKTGDSVKLNYVAVNGRTGKQFDSSFTSGKTLAFTLGDSSLPGFVKGLTGQTVGSRVLVAIAPKDGAGAMQTPDQLGLKKTDTMVFLFDLVSKVPDEATGTAKKLPADVPQIKLDTDKHPSGFTTSAKTTKKVSKEKAYTVVQGDGAAVKSGQTLTVQYVGQVYPGGKVFDESWSKGAPASFPVGTGGLIKCWDELLVGQKIGSRVVLVCPADKAYGDKPSGDIIKKGDTLIFAIDLLDAS